MYSSHENVNLNLICTGFKLTLGQTNSKDEKVKNFSLSNL